MTRTCARPGCGHEFEPRDRRSLYCSEKCGHAAYRARHGEDVRRRQREYNMRRKALRPTGPRKCRGGRRERIGEVRYAPYLVALLEQIDDGYNGA